MKLLLINKNPVVSRMMLMSVPKAGFEIEECESVYELPSGRFEVVVIDDEMYDENFLQDIKQNVKYNKLGLITTSKNFSNNDFDFILTKPFLPTDLIEILREVKSALEKEEAPNVVEEISKEVDNKYSQETPSPFERFMASDEEIEDNYLKNFESKLEPIELEKIVEVEEREEETPFIKEEMSKSGVLDEEEVEKVSQLLEETNEKEITPIIQDEKEVGISTPESILTSLVSEEKIISQENEIKPFIEPELKVDAQQNMGLEEEKIVPQIEKKEDEEFIEGFVNTEKENIKMEQIDTMQTADENNLYLKENEQNIENVAKEVTQNLNASILRELLDGMQLDITIKISFPDRK